MTKKFERPIFARSVRERRDALGLSQEKLAAKVGLHVNAIKNMELGKSEGTPTTRQAVADALHCSVADLYSDGVETNWVELSPRDILKLLMEADAELKRIRSSPFWQAYEKATPQRRKAALLVLTAQSQKAEELSHARRQKSKP